MVELVAHVVSSEDDGGVGAGDDEESGFVISSLVPCS